MKPFAAVLFFALVSCAPKPAPPVPQGKAIAPELKGMGEMTFQATAQHPDAQKFVRQGLALVYGFNHDEAARAFREAARLDPNCAMAYWGLALALAPNINDSIPAPEREQEAFEAITKARSLAAQAPESERAYIDALAIRFSAG